MLNRKVTLIVVFLMMAIVLQGCLVVAVGAAGAGTVAYLRGDLESVEAKDIDAVYAAAKKAVEQLEFHLISDAKDALAAVIVVSDAQNKKITINLRATTEGSTKISIRVGTFGSESKSILIYDQIKKNL